jgi:hypothetical protein
MADWPALSQLLDGPHFRFHETALIGDDLRLRCRADAAPSARS